MSDSSYFLRAGRRTMPPFRSSTSATQSPSLRLACLAIASGIRTARLFPHFEIVVSFRICIYFEYTSGLGRQARRHGRSPATNDQAYLKDPLPPFECLHVLGR